MQTRERRGVSLRLYLELFALTARHHSNANSNPHSNNQSRYLLTNSKIRATVLRDPRITNPSSLRRIRNRFKITLLHLHER